MIRHSSLFFKIRNYTIKIVMITQATQWIGTTWLTCRSHINTQRDLKQNWLITSTMLTIAGCLTIHYQRLESNRSLTPPTRAPLAIENESCEVKDVVHREWQLTFLLDLHVYVCTDKWTISIINPAIFRQFSVIYLIPPNFQAGIPLLTVTLTISGQFVV